MKGGQGCEHSALYYINLTMMTMYSEELKHETSYAVRRFHSRLPNTVTTTLTSAIRIKIMKY
jgi:hypothetical protein